MIITARFIRKLIKERGYTPYSIAFAIGLAPRTVRRYVSFGKDFREAPVPIAMLIKSLPKREGPPLRRPSQSSVGRVS